MKGHRRGKAPFCHGAQQFLGPVRTDPELGPEIIGRPPHRQGQTHGDFGIGGNAPRQFVQLAHAVDGIGGNTHLRRNLDLGEGAHGVVVMQHGAWANAAHGAHFLGAGHVKGGDARRHQIGQHLGPRIGLDRIGHKAGKPGLKGARRGLKPVWREIEQRRIGGLARQMRARIGPGGGVFHRAYLNLLRVFFECAANSRRFRVAFRIDCRKSSS